jgi:hypothetical protein
MDMKPYYCVYNQTKESFLGLKVIRATTSVSRLRDLLGRFRANKSEGLWMLPARGIHAAGVLFPVDVVYLDAENRVIKLVEHLKPFRFGPVRMACASVLELPPHMIYESQTEVGDQLLICRPEEIEIDLLRAKPPASAVSRAKKAEIG